MYINNKIYNNKTDAILYLTAFSKSHCINQSHWLHKLEMTK